LVCNGSGLCQDAKTTKGMAFIPAGTFWMGCNSAKDTDCGADESPQHKVTLSAYYMDLTETTVGQYKACVDAGGCTAPELGVGGTWPTKTNNPVNLVTRNQAYTFCKWRGSPFDLPTEAQWEMAARGDCEKNGSLATDPDCKARMRTYPWGDAPPSCSLAVYEVAGNPGCGTGATWVVGSKQAGDSPYGLHDMAGNVAEWTADWYGDYSATDQSNPSGPSEGVSWVPRGGWFEIGPGGIRSAGRGNANFSFRDFGFRCARKYP